MDREIELKFKTLSSFDKVKKIISSIPNESNNEGMATDVYWTLNTPEADFVRVREDGYINEITIKKKDRQDNFNRFELNVDTLGKTYEMMELLLGPPTRAISKDYYCVYLDNGVTSVSCFQIWGSDEVFIEIESPNEASTLLIASKVFQMMSDKEVYLETEPRSVFEMFIKGGQHEDAYTTDRDFFKRCECE